MMDTLMNHLKTAVIRFTAFLYSRKAESMKEQKNFFERYKPVFEIVCRILGNGWRVNLLDDCQYR